jgi:hypothetical protein
VVALHKRPYSKYKQHVDFLVLFAPLLPDLLARGTGAKKLLCLLVLVLLRAKQ